MKRKMKCRLCGTTKNSATNETLYILGGEDHTILHTLPKAGLCWDCGEKKRAEEEAKKQRTLSRMMEE